MKYANCQFLKKVYKINRDGVKNSIRNFSVEDISKKWKCAVGLEIHAQLSTETKLFSSASRFYTAPTNSQVSLFDASIPGTLPVLNKKAVELAVLSALALGCEINEVSHFERKHYFYPDMPAGYQITQQRFPIATNGSVEYSVYQPEKHTTPYYKLCKIKQIQLEQDSGKSLHDEKAMQSFIDLNRAGVPLIEIVFEPEIEDEEEAASLIKEIVKILKRVQSCSCKMEEGALRVDANVSVNQKGEKLGVRTEIKNIGSIRGVVKAIAYEKQRQIKLIESGEVIKKETLMWDTELNKTIIMRDKEDSEDYRFMPEPNLPPLRLIINENALYDNHSNVLRKNQIIDLRHLKKNLPPLPQEDRILLTKKYGLNEVFAYNLVNKEEMLKYFMEIMAENPSRNAKKTYMLLMYQLLNGLSTKNLDLETCHIPSQYLGQIVDLLQKRRISTMTVEYLIGELLNPSNAMSPFELVETKNLEIISNPRELRKFCLKIVEREIALVATYKKKKKNVFNELVKKVIEETKFRADTQILPSVMAEVLEEKLKKDH